MSPLEHIVAEVVKVTGRELKLYYIGNCSGYDPDKDTWHYDDRSWAVRIPSIADEWNRNHVAPHNIILGSTEELQHLTIALLAYRVGMAVGRYNERHARAALEALEAKARAPRACTGYRDESGSLQHDGDTCPIHEDAS
jgi:hypothetical protein